MKKVLFIDRDGTIIIEPKDNFQIDSLEKLEFIPYAISGLKRLSDAGYELIMVTNQDGLGTSSLPEDAFWPAHNKMLTTLKNEGILFSDIFIDNSLPEDNSPNRKPKTGLLQSYLKSNKIDLENSYVIGDRDTDIQLALNIGCKGIFLGDKNEKAVFTANDWQSITNYLTTNRMRYVKIQRNTNETKIELELNVDGTGDYEINTGLSFYTHMLEQFTKHSGIDLKLKVKGDLDIDEHHTIEDTAIALGQAFKQALGDKKGIERYGFLLPMDDALVQCALDFSGRTWLEFEGAFDREYVGDFPTEMLYHWLKSFSDNAGLNLNIKIEGDNTHHKVEATFKALARSIREAVKVTSNKLPSTKGKLGD